MKSIVNIIIIDVCRQIKVREEKNNQLLIKFGYK